MFFGFLGGGGGRNFSCIFLIFTRSQCNDKAPYTEGCGFDRRWSKTQNFYTDSDSSFAKQKQKNLSPDRFEVQICSVHKENLGISFLLIGRRVSVR